MVTKEKERGRERGEESLTINFAVKFISSSSRQDFWKDLNYETLDLCIFSCSCSLLQDAFLYIQLAFR